MTNREKLLSELAEMDERELFLTLCDRYAIDEALCADCRALGHICPEDCECEFEAEWMHMPCTRPRMLEVRV